MGKNQEEKRRGWLVLFMLRCPVPSERGPLFPEGSRGPPGLLPGWLCSVTTLTHRAWVRTRTPVCYCTPVISFCIYRASLVAQTVKNLPTVRETWLPSLGWEDPPGGGHDNPLQYSCLENSTDRGATVRWVAKTRTRLTTCACHHSMYDVLGTVLDTLLS